ncbi:IclR family transcriptional regulator [Streptomyces sp. NPDC050264]|uniref:IclR family transcriptional regulator n=1 Tax=Streptomyces sp. NPDC050264 TaxID=3155038 RepID=UPI00341E02D0
MPHSRQPGRSVSARLLDVLFAFRATKPRLTLAELTRATGLPHASVRRLALELVAAGALDRSPDGTFTVGIRLWEVGTLAPLSLPLRTVALPYMEDLHGALRQHVQIAVLEGTSAVLVERLSANHAVDVAFRPGGRLPLHSSGVGKVLLAHAGPELTEALLRDGLLAHTPSTVTDPVRLRAQLAEARESGTAEVHGETSPGVDSVATRVLDGDGEVVAALGVVVRAGTVDLRTVRPAVIASGLAVSRRLGWQSATGIRPC